jgi:multidrug efflux pump subunit AcrA (membrane-fusion protein)
MLLRRHHILIATVAVGLAVAGCGKASQFDNEAASDVGPSRLVSVKGSDLPRVILSRQAARRIGIETGQVRTAATRSLHDPSVIPYDAIVYDAEGHAFAYTNPRPLTFVRAPVRVVRSVGPVAVVTGGPRPGTRVVTVGAQELLGVEYGVEED